MELIKSGLKTVLGAPQGGPPPTGAETVEKLINRATSSTLLEDRRDACRALKAMSKKYCVEVGAQGMDVLTGVMVTDRSDAEIVGYALDTLCNITCSEVNEMDYSDEESSPDMKEIGGQFTEIFIKKPENVTYVLELLQEYDFHVRWPAVKLLTNLSRHQPKDLQECVLVSPMGLSKLMDLLSDSREVIRNDALLLLQQLTKNHANIQKIIAFENAFDRLLDIVEEEGLSDGGIVVEDCLVLLLNLLKNNTSNQTFFKEGSFIQKLGPFFRLQSDSEVDAGWSAQKVANIHLMLQVLRTLVAPSNPLQVTSSCQKVMNSCGLLQQLCTILMASGVPADILTEEMRLGFKAILLLIMWRVSRIRRLQYFEDWNKMKQLDLANARHVTLYHNPLLSKLMEPSFFLSIVFLYLYHNIYYFFLIPWLHLERGIAGFPRKINSSRKNDKTKWKKKLTFMGISRTKKNNVSPVDEGSNLEQICVKLNLVLNEAHIYGEGWYKIPPSSVYPGDPARKTKMLWTIAFDYNYSISLNLYEEERSCFVLYYFILTEQQQIFHASFSVTTITAGQLLCGGLFSGDPLSNWFASIALAHSLVENSTQKEQLLRVQLATRVGNPPVSLMNQCSTILQQGGKVQTRTGLLMLISMWLSGCSVAVTHFLNIPTNVPFLTSQVSHGEGDENEDIVQGICSFTLGLCILTNDDSVPSFTKEALCQLIEKRIGLETFLNKLGTISKSDYYTKSLHKPEPKYLQTTGIMFDYEFCRLFRSLEGEIVKAVQPRPKGSLLNGPDSNLSRDQHQLLTQYKDVIRQQDQQLNTLKANFSEIEADHSKCKTQIDEMTSTIQQLRDQNSLLKAHNVNQSNNSNHLDNNEDNRTQEMRQQIESYQSEILNIKQELQETYVHKSESAKSKLRIERLEDSLHEESVRARDYKDKIESLENQLADQRLENACSNVQSMQLASSQDDKKIEELKTENLDLGEQVENLQREQEDLLVLLSEQDTRISSYKNQLKELGVKVEDDDEDSLDNENFSDENQSDTPNVGDYFN
ncbi:General vesicular transport factor p115 [Nymphon striatum]|nr:General vesicular transport factor p115 [Nymphon striatum]